jgi:6-phosphofructo-2-kinase
VATNDERLLSEHYHTVASCSPDYCGVSSRTAEEDYRQRVEKYRAIFEPINEDLNHPVESRWSYFKCDHSSHHYVVHRVRGNIPLKIVQFIMNMRTTSHAFYLSRHGQSEYNAIGRIGGDSGLSQHGVNYAKELAMFVEEKVSLPIGSFHLPHPAPQHALLQKHLFNLFSLTLIFFPRL